MPNYRFTILARENSSRYYIVDIISWLIIKVVSHTMKKAIDSTN